MVARRRHACCRTRRSQGSEKVGDMYPSVKISAVLAQRGESVFRCVSLVRHALRHKLLRFCFLFRSRLGLASTQTQAAASTHTHPYTERPKDTIEKTTDSLLLRCLVGDERVLLHALCKATKYVVHLLLFFPIIVSVACPTGPHPPLRLARRPNRGHIGGGGWTPSCGTCL